MTIRTYLRIILVLKEQNNQFEPTMRAHISLFFEVTQSCFIANNLYHYNYFSDYMFVSKPRGTMSCHFLTVLFLFDLRVCFSRFSKKKKSKKCQIGIDIKIKYIFNLLIELGYDKFVDIPPSRLCLR